MTRYIVKRNLELATVVLLSLATQGCATHSSLGFLTKKEIMQAYLKDINKSDGINQKEAVLLAQSQLIFHGYENKYLIHEPHMGFDDKNFWVIKFYPANKTLVEVLESPIVLVTIAKDNGKVKLQKVSGFQNSQNS